MRWCEQTGRIWQHPQEGENVVVLALSVVAASFISGEVDYVFRDSSMVEQPAVKKACIAIARNAALTRNG